MLSPLLLPLPDLFFGCPDDDEDDDEEKDDDEDEPAVAFCGTYSVCLPYRALYAAQTALPASFCGRPLVRELHSPITAM
jgi:hypothetical protein